MNHGRIQHIQEVTMSFITEYTKAYQELEEAILVAFDNAYSDGVDMDEAFITVRDYVNASGCGDRTSMVEAIYEDWKEDYGLSELVLQGSF
jgi:hypothetical protein